MITRPLELASRLRPEPRNFDWLFFVNAALIGLFFVFFGSRFVLAPGVSADFRLPAIAGANAGARTTTHTVAVENAGMILAGDGRLDMRQLGEWLRAQARAAKQPPVLLVQANQTVPISVTLEIADLAKAAGFEVQIATR